MFVKFRCQPYQTIKCPDIWININKHFPRQYDLYKSLLGINFDAENTENYARIAKIPLRTRFYCIICYIFNMLYTLKVIFLMWTPQMQWEMFPKWIFLNMLSLSSGKLFPVEAIWRTNKHTIYISSATIWVVAANHPWASSSI